MLHFRPTGHSLTLSLLKPKSINESSVAALLLESSSSLLALTGVAATWQREEGWHGSKEDRRRRKGRFNMSTGTGNTPAKFNDVTKRKKWMMKCICEIGLLSGSQWEVERQKGLDQEAVKKKLGQLLPRKSYQTWKKKWKRWTKETREDCNPPSYWKEREKVCKRRGALQTRGLLCHISTCSFPLFPHLDFFFFNQQLSGHQKKTLPCFQYWQALFPLSARSLHLAPTLSPLPALQVMKR